MNTENSQTFTIDGAKSKTKPELIQEFARKLNFPDYYQTNWDSLEECLSDLSWIESNNIKIIIENRDQLLGEEPLQEIRVLQDILKEVAEESSKNIEILELHPFVKANQMPKRFTGPKNAKYAVIFMSEKGERDEEYYALDDLLMVEAKKIKGFLGIYNVGNEEGHSLTVSYWDSTDAIDQWKRHEQHLVAKSKALQGWYKSFSSYITHIEKDRHFELKV